MRIQNMFHDDINRQINGVIKVDQDANDVIEQEVREYVITKELRKHFSAFFNYYSDSFTVPTADIGVWISGFFGSGKSHFLKMLSYILENKSVAGTTTVEMFRQKFEDDPATFMQIDRATRGETQTILFNIDIESSINKDKTAVLRVFAKMFYNHLGFYGENLKVAMLEYYIEQSGKTEEFRRVFEQKKGKSWIETRRAFAFNGKFIIPTLMEVLDMSEEDAKRWFNDKTATELSIAQLVRDIKEYVDRKPKDMHCYLPGWEIPKFRPEHFTDDYGFITDYLSEFIRELRKEQYGDALDHYFRLGKNLNQRDTIAVRRMVDGYLKLVYPDGEFTKDDLEEILKLALEMRRRVKEQLKKLGGMEFYDVNFSYIDNETFEERYVTVPEQGGGKLIPEGMCNPGQVYTVSRGKSGMLGVFRLESQMLPGNGKFDRTGLGMDRDARESSNAAFSFLKANSNRISGNISTTMKDYIINYQDLQGIGMTGKLAMPTLIALASIALNKPVQSSMVVLGEMSISGTLIKVDELANSLQVCLDSGAKKVLLPITSAANLGTVPAELIGCFNLVFYSSAEDAVFKALGVE